MNTSTVPPTTTPANPYDYQQQELNVPYAACEIFVAIFAIIGNSLVIIVFRKERRLRRRTNYYIVSLATADLLVGLLGIPFAILSSIGRPEDNLHACLFTVSLLVVLCTISIFCLVAVSVDRYWAILHPMGYSRNVRTKTALVIISVCWFAGMVVGFLPLMGWHNHTPENRYCFFLNVMDLNYLVFLYFGTIITPALLLVGFYAHIYQVVVKQLRQIVTMNPKNGAKSRGSTSGGTMIRTLGVQQTNEVKATQNLAIIVLFFMICWIPLYTINCILAFKPGVEINSTFMLCCIILSHLNSAGNPLLYAYHLKDFRGALRNFLCAPFEKTKRQNCNLEKTCNYNYSSQYRLQIRNDRFFMQEAGKVLELEREESDDGFIEGEGSQNFNNEDKGKNAKLCLSSPQIFIIESTKKHPPESLGVLQLKKGRLNRSLSDSGELGVSPKPGSYFRDKSFMSCGC